MEKMISWLKPTGTNVIGTGLLLVANWAAGFLSRLAVPLLMGGEMGGRAAGFAGRQGGFAGPGGAGAVPGMQVAAFGLLPGAVDLVLLALLFYVVLSVAIGMSAKAPEVEVKRKVRR